VKLCKGSPTVTEHGVRDDGMLTRKENGTEWGNVNDSVIVVMD
jgi:hypothetical protein